MTHEDLVTAACRWLKSTKRCKQTYAEIVTAESETSDAIGWTHFACHVVECKTSRADMRADATKTHRITGRGMGSCRWVLSATGVLRLIQLGDSTGGVVASFAYDAANRRTQRYAQPNSAITRTEWHININGIVGANSFSSTL